MSSTPAWHECVTIGRVVKPQGRRGEVAVEPLSDRPDRFPGLERVLLPGPGDTVVERAVRSCWPHKGRYVLLLEGVDSIDAAERLRGLELRIPERELAPLPEGSFYHHELRGLRVEDQRGHALGVVSDLLEGCGTAVVLVVLGDAGETLVPLAEPFIRQVDRAAGRLVVVVPELVDAEA
jgi:16S rRNA processing protein RimM